MRTRTTLPAAMVITIVLSTACGGAPGGFVGPPSVGGSAETEGASPSIAASADASSAPAALLPDGVWEANITADDLRAAGADGDADPGRYRLTVDGSRVRIAFGNAWQCDADAEVDAEGLRLNWHPAMNCGGFDTVTWTVDEEGLHFDLVDTSGNEAGTIAILETLPYSPIQGEADLSWPDAWKTCENPNGGACQGDLEAGTYETLSFETPFTYTVGDGWSNLEDLPGNVLLVPPGASLSGVDAGTSDYISIFDGVAAQAAGCVEGPAPGVGQTPEDMMAFFAERADLEVTDPAPASVGGLTGLVADFSVADAAERCPQLPPGLGPAAFLIVGTGPADFNHGVFGELTIRLYLLTAPDGGVIAIEVDDLPGGTTMEELDAVARSVEFASRS